jgi:PAS domain S-box-containing protein
MLTLFHPEDAAKYERVMAASENGAPVSNVLLRIIRPDGALRLLELNAIVLFDDDGIARRRISAYRDVTEEHESRKALQSMTENLRRSREILAQAQRLARMGSDYRDLRDVGFSLGDAIEWSDMNYEIFGVDKETFVATNENFLELVHPDDRDLIIRNWADVIEGKVPKPFEYRVIRPDGALRYIYRETATTCDESGKSLHMIGIIHDITEQRAAAAELRRKTLELEEINKELHRSNAELEQFAYVASHDLQEPLRMVASYCQLLQRRYKEKLGADADEFIGYAIDGSRRMQQLINDLLSYSRVGRKGSDFETLDFSEVINEALRNLHVAIAESGATIEIANMPKIVGARLLLTQLIQNLVGNAIKFHRDGVSPIVHVTASREEASWHIAVEDNGIGIEQNYLDRVFLIFQRLHERDKYAGTGIGLAIAKKVIEYHSGRIWIESTPGQGSRFHFTLPAAAENGA